MNANAAANSRIRSEVGAVTTDGNRSEAEARAKLGIVVLRIARPTKISSLAPPNGGADVPVGSTHPTATRAMLPQGKSQRMRDQELDDFC